MEVPFQPVVETHSLTAKHQETKCVPIGKCDTDHIPNLLCGNKYRGIYRGMDLSGKIFGIAIIGYSIAYNGYLAQVTIVDPRYVVLPAKAGAQCLSYGIGGRPPL